MAYKGAPSLDAGAVYRPRKLLVDEWPPVEHHARDREASDRAFRSSRIDHARRRRQVTRCGVGGTGHRA
jgi:hypothetical protein